RPLRRTILKYIRPKHAWIASSKGLLDPPFNYLLVAKKFRNLWRRTREIFPPAPQCSRISRNRVAGGLFRAVGAGRAHRASLKSSACRRRPEIAPAVPIHHKKCGPDRKAGELWR